MNKTNREPGQTCDVCASHLTLDQHVEEVIAGLLRVTLSTQVTQIIMSDSESGQIADAHPLIVQTPTLRADDQVKELLRLRRCQKTGV